MKTCKLRDCILSRLLQPTGMMNRQSEPLAVMVNIPSYRRQDLWILLGSMRYHDPRSEKQRQHSEGYILSYKMYRECTERVP